MAKKDTELQVTPKYVYNRDNDTYVISMKHRVSPFVMSGYKVRAIRKAISNSISPSDTASDICIKYKLQAADFDAIKKAFDLTRDAFPLTDEEVLEDSVEINTNRILEERRTFISQEVEREEWRETIKDANCWRKFQQRKLDPFAAALDSWTPPKLTQFKCPAFKPSKKTLVVGLTDIHWGSYANSLYVYNDKSNGWDSTKSVKVVDEFSREVVNIGKERTYKFDKVVILLLGDLLHSVSGKTGRGTELKFDTIREEQFDYAMTTLSRFITNVARTFPQVEVHTVGGNHHYEAEIALYRALGSYFKDQSNITWNNYSTRPASFIVDSTLMLIDHGADAGERAYVPANESKLESHVDSLLLQKPELLTKVKTKLFLQGDKHHFKSIEFSNFEFIMFSTPVATDEHAAVNNWNNRARQSCLVLDEDGLKEILHFYTDSLLAK